MRSVLVTRPQPAAGELADKLRREGFDVYIAPMTEYVEVKTEIPDLALFQALVFTSAQAVNIFARASEERLPIVFAVGDATAHAAAKAGFQRVYTADGSGDDIVSLIRSKKSDLRLKRLLHICGEDTATDLGAALAGDGIHIESLPVYRAEFLDHLPEDAGKALAEGDISTVTLFSARTAANFVRLLQDEALKGVSADMEAVCISDRVASEIRGLPWRAVRIAKNAHLESVLDLLRAGDDSRPAAAPLPADPVIEAFGGLRPLANRLDITASTVQGWKKRGIIPETRVPAVLAAARDANIDLDSLWSREQRAQGEKTMSDDDKTKTGAGSAGGSSTGSSTGSGAGGGAGGGPKPQGGSYHDRRGGPDRRQKRAVVDRHGVVRSDAYTGPDRRSGVDRRSYEQRQQERIAKEKWRFLNRSVLMGAFFLVCVLYAGAFLLAPEFFQAGRDAERISKMQAQIDQMNLRMQQMQQQPSLGTRLHNQIGKLQDAAGTVTSTVSSTVSAAATVAKTAAQTTETGRALNQMLQVLSTLNTLNKTPEGRKAVDIAMEKLKAILNVTGSDPAALNAAISAARKSDPALDKILSHVAIEDLGAAALLLALNEYRGDVSNERPFQDDLMILQKFAGNDPQLQQSLQRLAPYAERGVLSRQRLQKEFKDLAAEIVMAKLRGEDLSVKEEMLRRLGNLVKVRRVDDIEGESVDAIVARAQIMLNQGNVKGAMHELNKLEGAPAQTAQPWMEQAAGTVLADETAASVTHLILEQLRERTGFDLQGLFQSVLGGGSGAVPYISQGGAQGATIGE